MMTGAGRPGRGLLSSNGAAMPSEFDETAKSIANREEQRFPGSDILQAAAAKWA